MTRFPILLILITISFARLDACGMYSYFEGRQPYFIAYGTVNLDKAGQEFYRYFKYNNFPWRLNAADIDEDNGNLVNEWKAFLSSKGIGGETAEQLLFGDEDTSVADGSIMASITNEAIDELGLEVGAPALAIFKSTDVIVGV